MSRKKNYPQARIKKTPITEETIDSMARTVARVIRRHVEGDESNVQTWINAAQGLQARVWRYNGQPNEPGYYDGATMSIFYNMNAPTEECIRYIIHELGHHVLTILPSSNYKRSALERYADDRNTVQHRVARKVEEIVLG
jgi:Zn-dependent peptidase ImmA (M78 family)